MEILLNESMKNHTTFNVGGNADILCIPENIKELKNILKICNKFNIPITIIGNGSNIIVKDEGIRGVVIKIANTINHIIINGNVITAGAGIMVNELIDYSIKYNLKGLEGICGIPGTLGGGIYMNVNYTKEIKYLIKQVKCINYQGKEFLFKPEQLEFEYRKSIFHNKKYIIIEADLQLKHGDCSRIVKKYINERNINQPIEFPSAGSIFKKNNLKNYQGLAVGDAEVRKSFIINKGNATAKDILSLIELIKEGKEIEVEIIGEG